MQAGAPGPAALWWAISNRPGSTRPFAASVDLEQQEQEEKEEDDLVVAASSHKDEVPSPEVGVRAWWQALPPRRLQERICKAALPLVVELLAGSMLCKQFCCRPPDVHAGSERIPGGHAPRAAAAT